MYGSPLPVADGFRTVGLAELESSAALLDRVDTKYVVARADLAALAEHLRATHAVLELGGVRAFRYRTTYFDTAGLRTYRDHVQERRRRFKCRVREYVDSGLCMFEVKLKGARGRTVKHRMPHGTGEHLSEPLLRFLEQRLAGAYGPLAEPLGPALAMTYRRVTLVAPGERVTCDFDLAFTAPDGRGGHLDGDAVIVESKSARGGALADRELRALGARPVQGCSKYCLGVGLTRPEVKRNGLLPLLRRYFHAA
jgi:VTC domain